MRLRREPPIFAVPRLFVERTVQLRKEFHDPPALRMFSVPVVKETSHDSAKVESPVQVGAGTPFFAAVAEPTMRRTCNAEDAGETPACGSSSVWACGVISSISPCEGDGVGANPTFAHQFPTAMPKSSRRPAATRTLLGASPRAVSKCHAPQA